MTLAENYLIWKAPKNLVLDSGFEPQIIVDLRLRIQEFTGQGSAGASQGLRSYSAKDGMHLHSHLVLMGRIDLHWSTVEYFWTQIEVSTMLLDPYDCILQHKNIRTMFVDTTQSRNIQAGRVG